MRALCEGLALISVLASCTHKGYLTLQKSFSPPPPHYRAAAATVRVTSACNEQSVVIANKHRFRNRIAMDNFNATFPQLSRPQRSSSVPASGALPDTAADATRQGGPQQQQPQKKKKTTTTKPRKLPGAPALSAAEAATGRATLLPAPGRARRLNYEASLAAWRRRKAAAEAEGRTFRERQPQAPGPTRRTANALRCKFLESLIISIIS